MKILLIFCNAPDIECARSMAERLVRSGAAACVNIGPPVESVYRWQGRIERAFEIPIAIKTTHDLYADVEREILDLHPHEVPELIAIQVDAGLPAYLSWVRDAGKSA